MLADKFYNLLIQEFPEHFRGFETFDSFVHFLATYWLVSHDKADELSIFADATKSTASRDTIQYCEDMFKNGYSAIINDGKLLGFRKEEKEEKKMPSDIAVSESN